MKIDTNKLLLVAVIIFLGWNAFLRPTPTIEPIPATITLPEESGTTGEIILEEVEKDTIYLKGNTEYIEVDKGWKEKYEQAKDSLEQVALYYEAIEIKNYSDTLVDNKDILITGEAQTRGSLLDYSVDYTIKSKDFTYTPKVVTQFPKLTLGLGSEVVVPSIVNNRFTVRGKVSLMNKKGHEINLGYDTENRFSVGYTFNIKLIK